MEKSKTVRQLFEEGQRKILAEGVAGEKEKAGVLRGGNSAIYIRETDTVVGKCAAQTYLRYKGIDLMNGTMTEQERMSRELMFEGGRANEDIWFDVLSKSSWAGPILREEEVPVKWMTDTGVPVTGRPDIVLCDIEAGIVVPSGSKVVYKNSVLLVDNREVMPQPRVVPKIGLELKQVSSLWTARDVLFEGMPKFDHLCQAGHYSWQLGIPFEIWYTSRSDFAVMGWAQKLFPKQGQPGSEHCEYSDKGDIKKVLPFTRHYLLEWDNDGVLLYSPDEGNHWHATEVSKQRIKDYYEFITNIDSTNTVPRPPENRKANNEKANWTAPDYCPLGDLCCGVCPPGTQADAWTEKVRERMSGMPENDE